MKGICPNTGYGAYATIDKWYYDTYTDEYEIHMEIYWTGKTWFGGDYQSFNIDGILRVDESGYSTFTKTYQNRAVTKANENNMFFTGTVIALVLIDEYANN